MKSWSEASPHRWYVLSLFLFFSFFSLYLSAPSPPLSLQLSLVYFYSSPCSNVLILSFYPTPFTSLQQTKSTIVLQVARGNYILPQKEGAYGIVLGDEATDEEIKEVEAYLSEKCLFRAGNKDEKIEDLPVRVNKYEEYGKKFAHSIHKGSLAFAAALIAGYVVLLSLSPSLSISIKWISSFSLSIEHLIR